MSVASPPNYKPNMEAYNFAKKESNKKGNNVEVIEDAETAVIDADIVVTDTFISMRSDSQREDRLNTFLPKYQVNKNLIDKAKSDAIFLHCLPAHRGEEVTADVIDGPRSVVWDEAENRLHTQKALLAYLLVDENSFQ